MAPETPIRRHLSLTAVVSTLRDELLRLTRLDTFDDPFEGSVPKKQIDDQVPLFSSHHVFSDGGMNPGLEQPRSEDPWTAVTRRRRKKTRSAHASSWTSGPESEAMWTLYCNDEGIRGQGLALESTLGRIESSVSAHGLLVSPITYRYYHEGPAFFDELDAFFHKRLGFVHENEVRLMKYDDEHYWRLEEAGRGAKTIDDLPTHIFLPWPAAEVVDRILVSPYASEEYEQRVREQISAICGSLSERLAFSILSERLYGPQF
jgi:hypothetical protein